MKFFVPVLFAMISAVRANLPVAHSAGLVNTGHSAQFRSQDSFGNYEFGYNEDHATGGTFRREAGSPGHAQGSYGLRTIDGRVRVVNYVADGHGFRANIQTNEPGVDPEQDPASVLINKAAAIVAPYLKAVEAPVAPAPIAMQHSVAAPIIAEPAPIAHAAGNPYLGHYESGPAAILSDAGHLSLGLNKYEPAMIESAAPLLSSYTTKTYASPAPILASGAYAEDLSGYTGHGALPLHLKKK